MTNVIRLPLGVCTNMMPPFYKNLGVSRWNVLKNFPILNILITKWTLGAKKCPMLSVGSSGQPCLCAGLVINFRVKKEKKTFDEGFLHTS